MRIALLSYRSKTHCGGQGVYVRHLSRGLVELGHEVEVFSGQPYPGGLDPRVRLTKVPSLDLYREPDPFRIPRPSEIRDRIDLLELLTTWTAGFPEPKTFCLRVARILAERRDEFDVVHDNQCLGYGLLGIRRTGLPVLATVHHPIQLDRRLELAQAGAGRRFALRRWYAFTAMQRRVARRLPRVLTVSNSARTEIVRELGIVAERVAVVSNGVDATLFQPRPWPPPAPTSR
jgi:glycosyltransferase involved in cell wall biosynthesis